MPERDIPVQAIEKEPLQDHCGIVVIHSTHEVDAYMTGYAGLYKLQTRGQDGAGVCAIDDEKIISHYGEGMIKDALGGDSFEKFRGITAKTWLFQTRYGTNGETSKFNLQPLMRKTRFGEIVAVVTNGQYVYENDPNGASDTVQFIEELVGLEGEDWDEKVLYMHSSKQGAGSTVIYTPGAVYLMRDQYGLRPLSYGVKYSHDREPIYCVASETAALRTMGVTEIIEVMPGSVVRLNSQGRSILREDIDFYPQAPCSFENAYLANGSSAIHIPRRNPFVINNAEDAASFRKKTGEILARREEKGLLESIDFVVGVPGTGIEGGRAYAETAGLPYIQVIADRKPQDLDARTFIEPDIQKKSKDELIQKIEKHFYIMPQPIYGKKILLVDDSIVRGNISGTLVALLKRSVEEGGYGAEEVHIRALFPPVDKPCYLGISTNRREYELLAAKYVDQERIEREGLTKDIWDEVVEAMRIDIGADSLSFVTAEDVYESAGSEDLCVGCTIGHYPPINRRGIIYEREIQRA